MKDGSTYDGQVRTKLQNFRKIFIKHGEGKQIYKDNSEYDGMWKNGKYHGFGKLQYENGDTYEGEFY